MSHFFLKRQKTNNTRSKKIIAFRGIFFYIGSTATRIGERRERSAVTRFSEHVHSVKAKPNRLWLSDLWCQRVILRYLVNYIFLLFISFDWKVKLWHVCFVLCVYVCLCVCVYVSLCFLSRCLSPSDCLINRTLVALRIKCCITLTLNKAAPWSRWDWAE